jgi:hypothetical protein
MARPWCQRLVSCRPLCVRSLIAQRLLPRLDPSDPHQAAVIASVNRYLQALQTRERGSGKSFQTIESNSLFLLGLST